MHHLNRLALALAISAPVAANNTTAVDEELLPVVSVTADFRDIEAFKSSNSITVIDAAAIARRDANHLDQVLNTAPNVNFSAGASRGRFLQVRGIGERSQFKDPLDASVGMIIDGIDYSGIGLAAALLDTKQVEILRGPQGTQFGSSAMAGMVNIQSHDASEEFAGQVRASVGNYNQRSAGAVINGALTDDLMGRVAVQKNTSDGYIDNDFVGDDDTNNIDEILAKTQLKWLASDQLTVRVMAQYVDADNGYNAFSLSNNRDIPTDDPGHDRQTSHALSVSMDWTGHERFELEASAFVESSELEYGFDWDWTNLPADGVRGSENNKRDRDAYGIDLRLLSKPGHNLLGAQWVAGIYASEREVELNYSDSWEDIFWGGPWINTFDSRFRTQRRAAYGQLRWNLSEHLALTSGLRLEKYSNDYRDSAGVDTDQDDNLWGGKLALEYTGIDNTLLFASASRGYKIGGVNGQAVGKVLGDPSTPPNIADFLIQRANFDAETLVNFEAGFKGSYLNNSLRLAVTAFYMDRQDMQANAWVLFPPSEWKSYLDNVDEGHNAGIELESRWLINERVTLFAALGWLDTELGELTVQDVDSGGPMDQSGRDQAHAPQYQFNVGMTVKLVDNMSLTLEADGKDSFYFSNSHNQQSDSHELLHMTLAYQLDQLSLSLWGRNLTDEDYQTRGFYFDNTPPNYDGSNTRTYHQLGEPRVFGVSASYSF
ncbi:TonB-dependent receptor [Pseudomaricurvus alkylphenolicus]|jgi:outer membrane receptor protein involved in Fe transport|uniref:TonB-dependent receptor n=1 Tax=Pseudomaricurvus alkylphenolicus TaxID=1306991 RepID=UPI00141FD21A|nr:TonB-dependent receptor [Pseudomaricurvus alkylphenolicus]NIB44015.1 TonB-dependent receptor [Pseudomaricurvus alkylphenolicus]